MRDLNLRFTKTGTFKSNYWSTQEVFSNRKDIVEMIEVGKRKKAKTTKKYKEIYQKTTEKCWRDEKTEYKLYSRLSEANKRTGDTWPILIVLIHSTTPGDTLWNNWKKPDG